MAVIKQGNLVLGIDPAGGEDMGVAVGYVLNGDGTIRVVYHREFYKDEEPDFDLDLQSRDVTDQRCLPKPSKFE